MPSEQEQSFCNKCGFFGSPSPLGTHLRPKDGVLCNYSASRSPGAVGSLDRPFMLAAARAWWARKMPNSNVRNVQISGDGRVNVWWQDHEESGKYTLPVDFIDLPTPDAVNADKALAEALRPFATEADRLSPLWFEADGTVHIDDSCEIWQVGDYTITRSKITYGDLRRARTALATPTPDKALMPEAAVGERRVAVAKALASHPDSSWDDYEWEDMASHVRELFLEQADLAIAAMPTPTPVEEPEKGATGDNCEICHGDKGGVRGNENRVGAVGGIVACDYCTADGSAEAALAATNAGQVEAKP